jgi:rhodanese-related sulfurtransferase
MNIHRISPEETQALLAAIEGAVYLDVRTPEEFAGGHVPGAINVPVAVTSPKGMQPNPDFLPEVNARFGKDTTLITGCLRGGRSMRAAGVLISDGFVAVHDMRGGWDGELSTNGEVAYPGWTRRGLPVER